MLMPCISSLVSATGSPRGAIRTTCCGSALPTASSAAASPRSKDRLRSDRSAIFDLRLVRLRRELDLKVVSFHAHRIAAGFHARAVGPGAVRQTKAPAMPRTSDDPLFHLAVAQRRPHVRTDVVDGEELAAMSKHGDQLAVDLNDAR